MKQIFEDSMLFFDLCACREVSNVQLLPTAFFLVGRCPCQLQAWKVRLLPVVIIVGLYKETRQQHSKKKQAFFLLAGCNWSTQQNKQTSSVLEEKRKKSCSTVRINQRLNTCNLEQKVSAKKQTHGSKTNIEQKKNKSKHRTKNQTHKQHDITPSGSKTRSPLW